MLFLACSGITVFFGCISESKFSMGIQFGVAVIQFGLAIRKFILEAARS